MENKAQRILSITESIETGTTDRGDVKSNGVGQLGVSVEKVPAKNCPSCGELVNIENFEYVFCPKCGTKVESMEKSLGSSLLELASLLEAPASSPFDDFKAIWNKDDFKPGLIPEPAKTAEVTQPVYHIGLDNSMFTINTNIEGDPKTVLGLSQADFVAAFQLDRQSIDFGKDLVSVDYAPRVLDGTLKEGSLETQTFIGYRDTFAEATPLKDYADDEEVLDSFIYITDESFLVAYKGFLYESTDASLFHYLFEQQGNVKDIVGIANVFADVAESGADLALVAKHGKALAGKIKAAKAKAPKGYRISVNPDGKVVKTKMSSKQIASLKARGKKMAKASSRVPSAVRAKVRMKNAKLSKNLKL